MSYAKQIVELVTLENLGECPLLRHGQAVDIALEADTEIAALKAKIREMTEWRPMESAPKDGTKILLFRTLDRLVIVGLWHDGHDEWIDGEYIAPIAHPDFWMPISELPSLPGSEEP